MLAKDTKEDDGEDDEDVEANALATRGETAALQWEPSWKGPSLLIHRERGKDDFKSSSINFNVEELMPKGKLTSLVRKAASL